MVAVSLVGVGLVEGVLPWFWRKSMFLLQHSINPKRIILLLIISIQSTG